MRVLNRARPRLFAAGVAAALALAGAQQAAAQSVFFSGFTAGCFGTGCTPLTGAVSYPASNGVTYQSSVFSGTTTNGVLTLSGANNFGTFRVGNLNPFNYTGSSFTLLITFIDPTANQSLFTATLSGNVVKPIGQTNVDILFDPTPQSWTDGFGNVYTVKVNDVLNIVPELQSHAVGGVLTADQTVPEPITMVLLGTGLAGLGVARKRRNRASKADLI
jgi:hypothetical protein